MMHREHGLGYRSMPGLLVNNLNKPSSRRQVGVKIVAEQGLEDSGPVIVHHAISYRSYLGLVVNALQSLAAHGTRLTGVARER